MSGRPASPSPEVTQAENGGTVETERWPYGGTGWMDWPTGDGHGAASGVGSAVAFGWRKTACRLVTGFACVATLAAGADSAAAFQIFGKKFFEKESEVAVVPDARPYTIDVTVAGEDKKLAGSVRAASALVGEEKRPPPGVAGLLARARGDYARILAALYSRGYYGGTITILIAGRSAADLRPDATLPDPAPVAVTVDPGPLFRFGRISIDGLPSTPLTREDEKALDLDNWELKQGDPALSGIILTTEGRLVELWRQRGHPKAEVVKRDIVADHDTNTVDVALVVEPGPAAEFGTVEVNGTERMVTSFVARQTGIKPGMPYDPDTLDRARKRLTRLGVFSSIAIVEGESVGPDGILPVTFNLAERKRRLIGGGASYSSTEGATLEGYWMHRNLFGRAESLRFDASVSRIGAEGYKDFNYAVATTFRRPGTFTPDTDLTLQVAGKREFVDTYESRSVSATAGVEHFFSEQLTGRAGVKIERSYVEDAFGDNNYLILSLPTELEYDGRDNKLDPTRGLRGTLKAEPFTDFDRGTVAFLASGTIAGYRALDAKDRFIVAARGGAGSIVGATLEEVPANKRFFLGGGGSIRGYDYRSVGPLLNGAVVGGLSYLEASAEFRMRVTERFGIVPFLDAGAAYADSIPDFDEDFQFGAGVGLRYYTPLGPLRLDVATPLNPRDGDPSVAFYVGLGQAF